MRKLRHREVRNAKQGFTFYVSYSKNFTLISNADRLLGRQYSDPWIRGEEGGWVAQGSNLIKTIQPVGGRARIQPVSDWSQDPNDYITAKYNKLLAGIWMSFHLFQFISNNTISHVNPCSVSCRVGPPTISLMYFTFSNLRVFEDAVSFPL